MVSYSLVRAESRYIFARAEPWNTSSGSVPPMDEPYLAGYVPTVEPFSTKVRVYSLASGSKYA